MGYDPKPVPPVPPSQPYAGKKWTVVGTSVSALELYAAALEPILGTTVPFTNQAQVGGTLSTAPSGSLAAATYFWVVTALSAGGETTKSNETTLVTSTQGSATISWAASTGGTVTAYRVYRGTAAGAENLYFQVGASVLSFTDVGGAGTAASPPGANTAGLTVPVQSAAVANGLGNGFIYTPKLVAVTSDTALLTIEAGYNDFRTNVLLGTIADTAVATSFYGALYAACVWIRSNLPNTVVYFLTPYGNAPPDTTTGLWNTPNANGNTLAQFRQAIRDVCGMHGFPVLDVGNEAGVGALTAAATLSDGIHLSPIGSYKMAQYLRGRINGGGYNVDPVGVFADLSLIIDGTKCMIGRLGVDAYGTLFCGANRPAAGQWWSGAIFKTGVRRVEYTRVSSNEQANYVSISADGTYYAAIGDYSVNNMLRAYPNVFNYDNITSPGALLVSPIKRRVRVDLVAGKARISSALSKGAAMTANYPDLPNAATQANAALNTITATGIQFGLLPYGPTPQPWPLGYDVYINDVPINQVLVSGVLPP